jgi:hypothetical protein
MRADTSAPSGATIIDLASFRARHAAPAPATPPAADLRPTDPRATDLRATDLRVGDRILCHETQEIGVVTSVAEAGGRTEIVIQFAARRRRCFADEIEGWRDHGAVAAQEGARAAAAVALPCDVEESYVEDCNPALPGLAAGEASPGQLALFTAAATSIPADRSERARP